MLQRGQRWGIRVIRAIQKYFTTFKDETERKKKNEERERESEREERQRGREEEEGKAVEWVSLVITAEVGAL